MNATTADADKLSAAITTEHLASILQGAMSRGEPVEVITATIVQVPDILPGWVTLYQQRADGRWTKSHEPADLFTLA